MAVLFERRGANFRFPEASSAAAFPVGQDQRVLLIETMAVFAEFARRLLGAASPHGFSSAGFAGVSTVRQNVGVHFVPRMAVFAVCGLVGFRSVRALPSMIFGSGDELEMVGSDAIANEAEVIPFEGPIGWSADEEVVGEE